MPKTWIRWLVPALALGLIAFGWLASRRGWLDGSRPTRVVVLYAYSTLDDVMMDRLLPAFRERWEKEHGEVLEFAATFAGSGEITGRLLDLVPAELAIVSSELDAHRLPVPHRSWAEQPHGGVLARTPMVMVVRAGNPLGIASLADLARDDVTLVCPDPARSGAANLLILAVYEAVRRAAGEGPAAAALAGLRERMTEPAASAREARARFAAGQGDVLVTYEQDVMATATRAALQGEIIHPRPTLIAEPVVVPIPRNILEENAEVVAALAEFLWSEEAQADLVEYGFHSVRPGLSPPAAGSLEESGDLTLADLGGAVRARREVLEGIWQQEAPARGR